MKDLRVSLFILAVTFIFSLWLAVAAQAQAQTACGKRADMVRVLDEDYGEVRRGGGLAGPTAIYEIWVSEATGTWTILKTTPNGVACVVAVGEGWHDDAGELTPTGDPV